jgi:Flp pilus assembly protein TadB
MVTPTLLMLLTFLAVVMAILGVYSVMSDMFLRDRTRVSRRVDDEFRKHQRDRAQRSGLFKNLDALADEAADSDAQPGLRKQFEALVEQSGLDLTPQRLLLMMVGAASALGVLGGLIRQNILVGLVAGLLGAAGPLFYVHLKRKARLEKLLAQLPDALDLMARVIRAGQTMSQALTAEGRMQAAVLLGLPPAIFVVMLLINRTYGAVLLDYPYLLVGMLVSEAFGALWIRKIINFDY